MTRPRLSDDCPLGFTLVELLVVLGIIGALAALLLPAIQAAREAARRTACGNNLKQLGLAAASHHDARSFFPPGGWGWAWEGDPDYTGSNQPGGWTYSLLPFMEQASLSKVGARSTAAAKASANALVVSTPLALFNCPSRRSATLYPVGGYSSYNSIRLNMVAKIDYAANAGDSGANQSAYGLDGGPTSIADGLAGVAGAADAYAWNPAAASMTGVIFQTSQIALRQIVDGTSKTFLLGEKNLCPDNYSTGTDNGDNEDAYSGWNNDSFRTTNVNFPPQPDTQGQCVYQKNFGSAHAGAMNMIMCDGSAHAISYDIEPTAFDYLGNRQDGQDVEADALP